MKSNTKDLISSLKHTIFDIQLQTEIYYGLWALFAIQSGSPVMGITILIWYLFI